MYPSLSEKVIHNKLAPNTTVSIPFYEVQKFVSNDTYRHVSQDNQVYMAELQVYDNHFFKTTTQLLANLIEITDSL